MLKSLLHRGGSRRMPAGFAPDLTLAPRERVLRWAQVESGARLVVTTHGLWARAPADGSEWGFTCWRDVRQFHADATGAFSYSADTDAGTSPAVGPGPTHAEVHHRAPGSDLAWAVQSMVATSRLVEQHYRLPSGSRLLISARDCPYERAISWTSAISPAPGADGDDDTRLAKRALHRAQAEYGSAEATG